MKVSIIVTCHNYGRYLSTCLRSIRKQTLKPEVVIYDDASDDEDTIRILKKMGDTHKIIFGAKHVGLAGACNRALQEVTGEYVMRLDADDWLSPHCVEIMSHYLDTRQDVGAVFSDFWYHEYGEERLGTQHLDIAPMGSCMMMRRSVMDKVGVYKEELVFQEDLEYFKRLSQFAKVDAIPLPLWYYRIHGDQMTRAHNERMKVRQEITEGPKVLTVIPARGGSKGVKRKNLYRLAGVPLVTRAIRLVKDSKIDAMIVVSTEDQEIKEVALREGVTVINRSVELAEDDVSTISVAKDAMEHMDAEGWRSDIVISVQPTCPYTPPWALKTGLSALSEDSLDSAVSVAEITGTHPYRAYQLKGGLLEPLFPLEAERYLQRQDRPTFYGFTGGFYVRRRVLLEIWNGEGFALGRCAGIVVPEYAALDIDNRMDIFLAETILDHWNDRKD